MITAPKNLPSLRQTILGFIDGMLASNHPQTDGELGKGELLSGSELMIVASRISVRIALMDDPVISVEEY